MQGRIRGKRWVVGSGNHGYWLGSYEQAKCRRFVQAIDQGHTVYDIGANVGYYTLLAATAAGRAGRVIAFEPQPVNLGFLRRHVDLNRMDQVEVLDCAVSDEAGETFFELGENRSAGRLFEGGSLRVRTVVLDQLIETGRIPPPNCMKIDVEGAELKILAGATCLLSKFKPDIFLATHSRQLHVSCCHLLRTFGYRLLPITVGRVEDADEILATAGSD